MHMLIELFPVLLFFISFKFYGIYIATKVGIAATLIQVMLTRVTKNKWDRMQLVTLFVFLLFGGLTLYFHNPIFVKWKPTIVFGLFAVIFLFTHYFTSKPLIQRLMETTLQDGKATIPETVWKRLNLFWATFFLMLGTVNLYVAYIFSNEAWVNFKFYGISFALILFSIFQACYLMRYITDTKNDGR